MHCENAVTVLFTENESNFERLWAVPNRSPFAKDSINDAIVQDRLELVNPSKVGTKAAAHYQFTLPPNETRTIRLRLRKIDPGSAHASGGPVGASPTGSRDKNVRGETPRTDREARALPGEESSGNAFSDFDEILAVRKAEADEFYNSLAPASLSAEHKSIQRQALSGLLWNKQFYYYIIEQWLAGDPAGPPPPASRWDGRNTEWRNVYNERVMSVSDNFPT